EQKDRLRTFPEQNGPAGSHAPGQVPLCRGGDGGHWRRSRQGPTGAGVRSCVGCGGSGSVATLNLSPRLGGGTAPVNFSVQEKKNTSWQCFPSILGLRGREGKLFQPEHQEVRRTFIHDS